MKITILKPSKGKVTTNWMKPEEVVGLIRSDRYSKEIGEFREVYSMIKEEKVEMPRVNNSLPALCFGAELERTEGNDFTRHNGYRPVIASENQLLLMEISNLKDYRVATRLRNMATQLPQTFMAFIGYDDHSLKIVVRFEPSGYDDNAEAYRDAFRDVRHFYSAQLQVTPDITDPSATQLCTLSHDPEAFYNEFAVPFYLSAQNHAETAAHLSWNKENISSSDKQQDNAKLLPGRDAEQTERMVFQFCLEKALDKHIMAFDGEEAERVLCSLAKYCRESDIPLANAIRKVSYRPDLNGDMELVRHIFTTTYKQKAKKKGDPMRHANQNSLLMWNTQFFMDTYYDLRMNMLTHRAEFRRKDVPGDTFRTLEAEDQNSMTIRAQAAGLKSWDRDLNRYINSREIAQFNPIEDYLCALPRWDGKDHVSMLADRVPTDTPNWKEFFHTWLLGMVAGWMGRDSEHSNALVPLLTGRQGTGKTSFCRVLLPRELRPYYAENLNLKSETTIALAMSSRALINIDEFDKYTRSQHPLLKFLISQNDVDMRLPFASHMEMRRRFASFIATTNSDRPLVDTTGSRRYLCVRVTDTIDFTTPIDYPQLYAQLLSEVQNGRPFWLNDEQTRLLMAQNEEFLSIAGLPQMLSAVVTPAKADEDGEWLSLTEILERVKKMFPHYVPTANVYHELGRCLKAMSTEVIHTREGNTYKVRAKQCFFTKKKKRNQYHNITSPANV